MFFFGFFLVFVLVNMFVYWFLNFENLVGFCSIFNVKGDNCFFFFLLVWGFFFMGVEYVYVFCFWFIILIGSGCGSGSGSGSELDNLGWL